MVRLSIPAGRGRAFFSAEGFARQTADGRRCEALVTHDVRDLGWDGNDPNPSLQASGQLFELRSAVRDEDDQKYKDGTRQFSVWRGK